MKEAVAEVGHSLCSPPDLSPGSGGSGHWGMYGIRHRIPSLVTMTSLREDLLEPEAGFKDYRDDDGQQ